MPKIAELRKIDGQIWVRVDMPAEQPITFLTGPEMDALEQDITRGCIEVVSWFRDVENFTAEDVIARIRSACL